MANRSDYWFNRCGRIIFTTRLFTVVLAAIACISAHGQEQPAPTIVWRADGPTPVVAIDSQTNVYCSSLGGVVTIAGNGVIQGTNSMCPAGGACQRDASGNFYFAGPFTPPVNFGVTNLTSGNLFIAKYNSSGTCLWAKVFGPTVTIDHNYYDSLTFGDLQLDSQGNAYTCESLIYQEDQSFSSGLHKFDPSGSNVWSVGVPFAVLAPPEVIQVICKIGGLTDSNGYIVHFAAEFGPVYAALSEFNISNGGMTLFTNWTTSAFAQAGLHPAADANGGVYCVRGGWLERRNSAGAVTLMQSIPGNAPFTMAADIWGGVYVGDNNAYLYHYDSAGNLIWQMVLPAVPNGMVSDAQGNRAVSLTTGVTYWLSQDILTPPTITNQPVGQTIMAGSNVTFTVGATGSTPFSYFWQQGTNVVMAGASATLTLTNVTTNQAGLYSVTVSNFVGTSNSASVQLRVKEVELFSGNQLLTNGTYNFTNTPVFTVVSKFINGSSFYTLDGSTPSFLSTPYTGPFSITNPATIQAIGYTADFSQSEMADTVIAFPPVQYTLTVSTPGGGSVALNPPGGLYLSGSNVTVTATPAAGFSFLYWTNGAAGNNPLLNVTMNTNKTATAIFGTTLSNTIAGSGQVFIYPPGPLYPYGTIVRLSALPQSGNCFGVWGNAGSGSTNPLFFTISNANPVISAAFAATPGGDAALTVLISGGGHVNASPTGNYFPLNQSVTLTAVPDAGKTFLGWSGDVSSTNNPLNFTLSQSDVITANFSGTTSLRVNKAGGDGLSPQGFRLTLVSDQQGVFPIQSSLDLFSWESAGSVTNVGSSVQFTDPTATNSSMKFYQIAPGP